MHRILLIEPLGTDLHLERDRRLAQSAMSADTEVEVRHLPELPASAYLPAEDVLLSPLLGAVRRADAEGFDAIGILCASDPGLREAKALVSTPVTGPFEAATRVAASFGRFSVMYPGVASGPGENLPQDSNWIRGLARDYEVSELLGNCAAVAVARPADEITAQHGRDAEAQALTTGTQTLANMTDAIRGRGPAIAQSLWRDGEAQSIFVACTLWSGELEPLREAVPIPVLDPVQTLARYTQLLAVTRSWT